MDRSNFMKRIVFYCFLCSLSINILSYIFYSQYLFLLCWFLLVPLFYFGFHTVLKRKNNLHQWTQNEKTILLILSIFCILTFIYTLYLLGNNIYEKNNYGYILKYRTTYIREATEIEYNLYVSRLSRLFSGIFLLFFYTFWVKSKDI